MGIPLGAKGINYGPFLTPPSPAEDCLFRITVYGIRKNQ